MKGLSFGITALVCLLGSVVSHGAQPGAPVAKFQQLDPIASPRTQRSGHASGAPGTGYWQNRADYDINVELDDVKRTITGEATVTYHNASPDTLEYLWVQLDQNYLSHNADSRRRRTRSVGLIRQGHLFGSRPAAGL
jgi:hypothetical protein